MKTIITCGHPYSGFQLAYEVQVQAGLARPQPSRREAMSVEELHDKIFKAHDLDRDGLRANSPLEPGRIWQDLAADLFIGNIDQGDWGWADARSVWLLDFWKDLDPQIRFVLAYSSPEYAIGTALRDRRAGPDDIDAILASWVAYCSGMLRFYNRNPDRCLLVNVSTVIHERPSFVEALNNSFKLKLNPAPSGEQLDQGSIPAIAATLARTLSENHVEAPALYRELESAADIGDAGARAADAENRLAVEEYSAILSLIDQKDTEAQDCQERTNRLEAERSKLSDELRSQAIRLSQSQADCYDLNQQQAKLSGQQGELERQLQKVKQSAEKEQLRLTQENELLLNQLHQVQEELEDYFGRSQEQSTQLAAEQEKIQRLTQATSQQAKLTTDQQAQIQKLTQTRDKQAAIAEKEQLRLAQENELLLNQLHQVQEELEGYLNHSQEQATQFAAEQAKVQRLTQATAEQAKLATDQQAQIQKLTQAQIEHENLKKQHSELRAKQSSLESKLKNIESSGSEKLADLNKENELLLVQLHQVQEELEHYFRQWQELSRKIAASTEASSAAAAHQRDKYQPSELVIDFRGEIDGDNWYYAEHDGRWAGPEQLSTLRLPSLTGRRCELFLDVVDAMEPEILAGMAVTLNGMPLETTVEGAEYPTVVYSDFALVDSARLPVWEFRFSFPGVVSPAELGSDDHRHLAIRVRSLKLRVSE